MPTLAAAPLAQVESTACGVPQWAHRSADRSPKAPCVTDESDDTPDAADNYCETVQLRDVLSSKGYVFDQDLWHWWEDGAPHNEAAWAARAFRPLQAFEKL